jgi:hypothetical protein
MGLALLSCLGFRGRKVKTPARPLAPPVFRPTVEGLEDRVVPAATPTASLPLAIQDLHVTGTGATQALEGTATLAGQALDTAVPVTLSTTAPAATDPNQCPILNVDLEQGLHLNLLGLHVDTSPICLDVTATNHQGLLGGLLCDLQQGGLNLGGILSQLGTSLNTFLTDLDQLLTTVLSQRMAVTNVLGQPVGAAQQQASPAGFCDILNLSLGPVDLDVPLLGVDVTLNNCATPPGPVTVDVTADPSGGLLGSLLRSLDDLNLSGLNLNRLTRQVDRLINQLGNLTGNLDQLTSAVDRLATQLERLAGRLPGSLTQQLDRVINQLGQVVDRLDTLINNLPAGTQLGQISDQLGQIVDQLNTLIGRLG